MPSLRRKPKRNEHWGWTYLSVAALLLVAFYLSACANVEAAIAPASLEDLTLAMAADAESWIGWLLALFGG